MNALLTGARGLSQLRTIQRSHLCCHAPRNDPALASPPNAFGAFDPHRIRLPVRLTIRRDIPPRRRIVMRHSNRRRHTRTVGTKRTWRRRRRNHIRLRRRLVDRTRCNRPRRCSCGRRPCRQRCPVDRTKSPRLMPTRPSGGTPWDSRSGSSGYGPSACCRSAKRHVLFIAVADFDCGSALPALSERGTRSTYCSPNADMAAHRGMHVGGDLRRGVDRQCGFRRSRSGRPRSRRRSAHPGRWCR